MAMNTNETVALIAVVTTFGRRTGAVGGENAGSPIPNVATGISQG